MAKDKKANNMVRFCVYKVQRLMDRGKKRRRLCYHIWTQVCYVCCDDLQKIVINKLTPLFFGKFTGALV